MTTVQSTYPVDTGHDPRFDSVRPLESDHSATRMMSLPARIGELISPTPSQKFEEDRSIPSARTLR